MSLDNFSFLSKQIKYNRITLGLGICMLSMAIPCSLVFYSNFIKKVDAEYAKEKAAYLIKNHDREEIVLLRERVTSLEGAFIESMHYMMFICAVFVGTIIMISGVNFIFFWLQARKYIKFIQEKIR